MDGKRADVSDELDDDELIFLVQHRYEEREMNTIERERENI
jgi:hypothetical protein